MTAAELEFAASDGTRLVGTLAQPEAGPPALAALILSGSGPLDRDSNMPRQVLNIGSALAAALAAQGVASLRYDKRGVGASEGDYLTSGFDDETWDAFAALDALRRAVGDRAAVIGHSVGATIAIRLAAAQPTLAGAVLLAAASRPGADVMEVQSDRIAATLPGPGWLLSRTFLRRQERTRDRLLDSTDDVVRQGRAEHPARWFREYMAYDPARDLPSVRCPVLAITGANDLQVEPDEVARIGELVAGPFEGDTPEAMTHLLRKHPGRPTITSYRAQMKQPVDAELLARIASWVAGRP